MIDKLVINGVRKSYGPVVALRETSLKVAAGEFLTLLGPSGSGKTTLLSVLAGLITPDGGEIFVDGVEATYEPVHRRDIGLVFQNYALFPHLTVFENVAFPLRMRRVPEAEIKQRVAQMLEIVQLAHAGDRLPRELSGGQQQRIAFARCAVYRPSVILMDEPLGALDKKLRDQMQVEIKRLHHELGATIIYVTHDQEEAMAMSDRICLMRNGGIEQLGTPAELYFTPRTVFAADFIGNANILPITARSPQGLEGPAGLALKTASSCGLARDDLRHFMVRPEHLRLLHPGEAADNMLDVTVEHVVMTGPVTRYHTRLGGQLEIVVTQLTEGPEPRQQPGAQARLGWSAGHTVLLAESGS